MEWLQKLGLTVVLVLAMACGSTSETNGDVATEDPAAQDLTADVMPAETTRPEEIAYTCPSTNLVIEFFGIDDGMTIETGEQMLVQARIFDGVLGQVIEGAPVVFSLAGDGDAKLLETSVLTNDLGVASVTLDTGHDLGVDYQLTVTNPCVAALTLSLTTVAPEQGTFMVTFSLAPELTELWGTLDIVAYANNTIPLCGGVNFTSPPGQGTPLPAGGETVEFTQVQANAGYVVFGVAYNADGVPVGGGCTEGVSVLPDKTTEVAVAIEALAMNPAGGYQLTLEVPVKDLLGDQWLDAGAVVQSLMDTAGTTIGNKVLDDILIFFPDGLPDCGDIDAAEDIQGSIDAGLSTMDSALTDWVAANADNWLTELTQEVVITGKLMVEETAQNQVWSAKWTVESVRFAGTIECGEADCTSWQLFTPESFTLGDAHIELDQEVLELSATGFDTLEVLPYQLPIEPGKLALFALTNIVLRKQGLDNELVTLFTQSFSCSTLLSKVTAQTIACLNKPQNGFIESCDAAVAGMATAFYNELAAYTTDQVLDGGGTLTSADGNNDLTVDGLSGTLTGDVLYSGAAKSTYSIQCDATKL